MNIKKGQWVRIQYYIGQFQLFDTNNHMKTTDYKGNPMLFTVDYYENAKIADTPLELVQDDDLVHSYNEITHPEIVAQTKEHTVRLASGLVLQKKNISLILTPDNNGNYIKQWEVE
jgi:hypothetical protein